MEEKAVSQPTRSERVFLPDFCRIHMVFGVVVTAELLAILLAIGSPSPLTSFWERLGPLSLYVQVIALTGSAMMCALRPALGRIGDWAAAVFAWFLLLALTALVGWAAYRLLPWGAGHLFPGDGFAGFLTRSLGVCAIFGALLLRYVYLHSLWRRQVEAEADARVQKLQARIRPHFLFNSLNTIASLTRTDPELAEELLQDLADLFRAALAKDSQRATLGEELELSRRYLNIEQQRLGERLRIEWEVAELPREAILPPLILQPLVENAVHHGVEPAREPGVVRVDGRYRRGQVNLCVRNSLPDGSERESPASGARMAMDNVRQRLAAMYPGAGCVTASRVEGDYQVRLVFPYPWRER